MERNIFMVVKRTYVTDCHGDMTVHLSVSVPDSLITVVTGRRGPGSVIG